MRKEVKQLLIGFILFVASVIFLGIGLTRVNPLFLVLSILILIPAVGLIIVGHKGIAEK